MSPELLAPPAKNSRPTRSSDCYALGMVIYETISGKLPFHEYTDPAVVVKVLEGERPPRGARFTDSLWRMLEQCWTPQPDDRPSIGDVLQYLEAVSNLWEPYSPAADEEMGKGGDSWESPSGPSDVSNRAGGMTTERNIATTSSLITDHFFFFFFF